MGLAVEAVPLPVVNDGYALNPKLITRTKGNGRAIAVAKLRELADRLESGELDGVRCQWRDTHGVLVEDAAGNQYDLTKVDAPEGAQPISGLEFMTRTAWTEDGSGTVQLVGVTIEEV